MRRWLLPALCVALLFWAGCGGSDEGDAPADAGDGGGTVETVKLAAPMELTGPVAAYGEPALKAFQHAVDVINEQGGIKSLGGAKLELIVQDSESDPQKAIQMLREMDREEPIAAIGPIGSANVVAIKPVTVSLGLPHLGYALEETITDGDHGHNMWRLVTGAAEFVGATMDFIEDSIKNGDIKVEKLAFAHQTVPPGPSLAEAVEARGKEMGIEVQSFAYNPEETRDYGALVARIRDFDPDLVSGLNYPADGILLTEAISRQNWRPSQGFVMMGGAFYLSSFREQMGAATENWISASHGSAVDTGCEMADRLNADFMESSGGLALTGSDTGSASVIAVIADALERSGTRDRDDFREALAETDLEFCESTYLYAGGVDFDERGDNSGFIPTIVQHVGERDLIGVYPDVVAATKATWPAHDKR